MCTDQKENSKETTKSLRLEKNLLDEGVIAGERKMESSNQNVIKFTGENWITWKFQVLIVLKAKIVYDVVTGTRKRPAASSEEWEKLDVKAQEIIVTKMEEGPLVHLLSCGTSNEM